MTFSVQSAINYNSSKYHSAKTVGIIQARLGCATKGVFNSETVTAIYNWQKSPNRTATLDADGKLGKLSLGVMISEMEKAGLYTDAQTLRQYPFNLPTPGGGETSGAVNPIANFFRYDVFALKLEQNPDNPNGWRMQGRFRVGLNINMLETEPWRYEYRQYIKGYAFTQKGYWNPEKTIWTARDGEPKQPANKYFLVPWGLETNWKEDGQVMQDGTITRFGYRNRPNTIKQGIVDAYSPNQWGWDYVLEDTFGLEGLSERGMRIGIEIYYRGVVVKDGTTEIASKQWGYKAEDAIRWID